MALFGRDQSKVGLDIGSGFVKAVVINHGKGGLAVTHVALTPIVSDAIVEGEIMDPGVVADTIQDLFKGSGIKQKKVVVAVGGRDVIIKKIQVDRMKESDAQEVVRWEAQQHVPFDIEAVELDFQILDPLGEGLQMDVLLVAAKRDLVEDRVQLLQQAGLDPEAVDVDAFALHNALEFNYPEAMQGVTALLNIGHELTNINVLQESVPVLTRDLTVGTRKLREDLQRERGASAEDADQLLMGTEMDPDLQQYVEARSDEIAVGVERAQAFLQSASREAGSIHHIYCSGGGARVHGLANALSQRLRIPVEVANPMQGVAVDEGVFGRVNVDEVAPLLMLATGLALRGA
jgi:type IV pilus assembly protein PilM